MGSLFSPRREIPILEQEMNMQMIRPRRSTPTERKLLVEKVTSYAFDHDVSLPVACKQVGVKYYNFWYWKQQLQSQQRVEKIMSSQYKPMVEVILVGAS